MDKRLQYYLALYLMIGGVLLFGGADFSLAYSEKRLAQLDSPLTVQLKTALQAKANQGFEAVLTEDYLYRKQVLPAGTLLRGRVAQIQEPRHFKRSGYLILSVDEARFPSGQGVQFKVGEPPQGELTKKLKKRGTHQKGSFKRKFFRYTLPITAVGLTTSLSLRFGTDLSFYATYPITTAAKMATGTTMEFIYDDHDGAKDKILWGMYRGSGLPTLVSIGKMGKRGPAVPSYQAGDNLVIDIHPDGMEKLFAAAQGDFLPPPPKSAFKMK